MLRRTVTDYSGERTTLELTRDLVDEGTRVFVVEVRKSLRDFRANRNATRFGDDWVETGAQRTAATDLVERADGEVVGVSVLRARRDERTLFERYDVHTIG